VVRRHFPPPGFRTCEGGAPEGKYKKTPETNLMICAMQQSGMAARSARSHPVRARAAPDAQTSLDEPEKERRQGTTERVGAVC